MKNCILTLSSILVKLLAGEQQVVENVHKPKKTTRLMEKKSGRRGGLKVTIVDRKFYKAQQRIPHFPCFIPFY